MKKDENPDDRKLRKLEERMNLFEHENKKLEIENKKLKSSVKTMEERMNLFEHKYENILKELYDLKDKIGNHIVLKQNGTPQPISLSQPSLDINAWENEDIKHLIFFENLETFSMNYRKLKDLTCLSLLKNPKKLENINIINLKDQMVDYSLLHTIIGENIITLKDYTISGNPPIIKKMSSNDLFTKIIPLKQINNLSFHTREGGLICIY